MKLAKRLMSSLILVTMLGTTAVRANADECCVDNGGCGYDECCRTSSLAPAIALGAIALVAIIAVAVQNTSGHSHCHAHD